MDREQTTLRLPSELRGAQKAGAEKWSRDECDYDSGS